jgi:hypothetical protein
MKHFGEFRRHLWQARSIACLGARDRSWRRPARQSVRRPRPPLEDEWGAHEAPSPRATGPRTMFRSPAAACVRQRRSGIAPGAVVWENRRRFLAQFRRQATLPCVGRRAMGQNRPHGRLTCSLAPPPAITRKNQHWALGSGHWQHRRGALVEVAGYSTQRCISEFAMCSARPAWPAC